MLTIYKKVYREVVKDLFPQHVYSDATILKDRLKDIMDRQHSEHMAKLTPTKFTNLFAATWASEVNGSQFSSTVGFLITLIFNNSC